VNLPLQLAAAAAAAAEEEANDQEGKPVQIGSSLGQGLGLSLGQVANSQLLYLSHLLLIPVSLPQWYRHRTSGIICREKGVQLANAHGHMACSTEASQRFLHSSSSSPTALGTRD